MSMMSPASSLSAVCASLSSKISLILSFTERRSFLIAPPSVPNQFRICEGALPVFPVPCVRQRNDALHALFFKFPIFIDVDFLQNIFLPSLTADEHTRFLYAVYPFMFGVYPYTAVTEKQKRAMENAGVKYETYSVREITRSLVSALLNGFLNK